MAMKTSLLNDQFLYSQDLPPVIFCHKLNQWKGDTAAVHLDYEQSPIFIGSSGRNVHAVTKSLCTGSFSRVASLCSMQLSCSLACAPTRLTLRSKNEGLLVAESSQVTCSVRCSVSVSPFTGGAFVWGRNYRTQFHPPKYFPFWWRRNRSHSQRSAYFALTLPSI